MENNVNTSASAEELVTTDKFQWSDLWKKEDWQAVWIGFIVIIAGAVGVITGAYDFSAANFGTWGNGTSLVQQLTAGFFWETAFDRVGARHTFCDRECASGRFCQEIRTGLFGAIRPCGFGAAHQCGIYDEPVFGMGILGDHRRPADIQYRRSTRLAETGRTDRVLY